MNVLQLVSGLAQRKLWRESPAENHCAGRLWQGLFPRA